MTYNQLVNTSGTYANQSNFSDSANNLPTLKGSLDAKTVKTINKYYAKYKKIETKTGVPWKALAAIDQATGYPLGMVAKKVQKYAESLNMRLDPSSDARDVVDLINILKKEHPDKAQLFDAFLSQYQRIDGAYE